MMWKKCLNQPCPIQGRQVMDTPSTPSPPSLAAPIKITKHSKYCTICTPLGRICPKEFAMSSDWNEDDDQAKDKEKDQKQLQTSPKFFETLTKTLQPPKLYITQYFDSMTSNAPLIYTPKEKQRRDTIIAQQELNTTECEALDQDLLEDIY